MGAEISTRPGARCREKGHAPRPTAPNPPMQSSVGFIRADNPLSAWYHREDLQKMESVNMMKYA
jgi:hypothetical protein